MAAATTPEPPVAFINVPYLFDTKPFAELIFIASEAARRHMPSIAE